MSLQHLTQMLLKQLTLEELPEVIAHHADLLLRAFGNKAAAPQKIADALLPGGIALLLPEFHLLGVMIQYDHLADAVKIADGIDPLLHRDGDLLAGDPHVDGNALEAHLQPQLHRLAVPQVLIHRLDARPMIDTHRRQHVAAAEPVILYADGRQILRGQPAVVRTHGGGGQDHHVSRLQPSGGMGIDAVIIQAEALLGLLVDMGHDALPVHGEHGVRGRIHYALQNIHCTSPFPAVLLLFYTITPPFAMHTKTKPIQGFVFDLCIFTGRRRTCRRRSRGGRPHSSCRPSA